MNINVATIGVGLELDLDRATTQSIVERYAAFATTRPHAILKVTRFPAPGRDEIGDRPSARRTNGALTIELEGAYTVAIDASRRRGFLEFADRTTNLVTHPVPPGLQAALRALYSVLICERGGLLIHGCGIDLGSRAAIFVGPSGAGKSTLSAMFDSGRVLSDELVALSFEGRSVVAHGTPFSYTDASHPRHLSLPLAYGGILSKGRRSSIATVTATAAFSAVTKCLALPYGCLDLEDAAFQRAGCLVGGVPWTSLRFSTDRATTKRAVKAGVKLFP
ncbi:MAG: hypothetical protein HY903_20680 [Deltaproteobacteria bacterium]|nr:hypothetical protein [Deltaproteobacteria bacterium]